MRADGIHPIVRALSLAWLVPRRALLRRRLSRPVVERVCGHEIRVLPGVFNPVVFRSGCYFAEFLNNEYLPQQDSGPLSILDIGTGSGVLAVVCASHGHNVTATDVSSAAIECAEYNAVACSYKGRIEIRQGDLFAPVGERRFHRILWNPPFFAGKPVTQFELSWRSDDAIDRFAAELPNHLMPGGRALIIWSSQSDTATLCERLRLHGLTPRLLRDAHFGVERLAIYEISPSE